MCAVVGTAEGREHVITFDMGGARNRSASRNAISHYKRIDFTSLTALAQIWSRSALALAWKMNESPSVLFIGYLSSRNEE
jgi:hypothetical protein